MVQVDHALHENVTPDQGAAFAAGIRASLGDPAYGKAAPAPGTPEWNG